LQDLQVVTALWLGGYRPPALRVPNSCPVIFIPWPLKKHLAGKWFATDTVVKQDVPPGYKHLKLISSMLGYRPWWHGGTNAW